MLRIAALAVLSLSLIGCAARVQPASDAERFTAFAVNPEGGAAGTVQIAVNRWTTDEQRARLVQTLRESGPEALLAALQDVPELGTIRTPDSLGYPLHYAHQTPREDGGRRIVIATDRPIGFWEAVNRPRTIDYPFTVVQIEMGPDGVGEGKMSVATRILAYQNIIELENFAAQPVRLQQVRSEPR